MEDGPPPLEGNRRPPQEALRGDIVHYGPGNRLLCGDEDDQAQHTRDPVQVAGCEECLELAAEELADQNEYRGHCLHCRREIVAQGGVTWRRIIRNPCPHCGRAGW